MKLGLAPTLAVSLLASPASADGVVRLRTNAAADPLGIDTPRPHFSWALESDRRGVLQTRYHVLVASRPELLRAGRADVWDSGDVASDEPASSYAGPALRSRTRYFWSVRVRASAMG